eukprot:scaffold28647_cov59-Phaeocystis_antarctica.AAC.2
MAAVATAAAAGQRSSHAPAGASLPCECAQSAAFHSTRVCSPRPAPQSPPAVPAPGGRGPARHQRRRGRCELSGAAPPKATAPAASGPASGAARPAFAPPALPPALSAAAAARP